MEKVSLFIFGTRPEAIKLAPLIIKFLEKGEKIYACNTGQHKDLIQDVIDLFDLKIDFNLHIMKENQNLTSLTSNLIVEVQKIIETLNPDRVFVHGDTTTCFTASLATFYSKKRLIHVEAGLRTNNKHSPYPEEMNRQLVSKLADVNLCPTEEAKINLINEGISPEKIYITGNTVVDALFLARDIVKNNFNSEVNSLIKKKRFVLFTGHRRENFGDGFKNIFEALIEIANNNRETQFIYPVHPNPNIRKVAFDYLSGIENIELTKPIKYGDFVWLMENCLFVITDSGGIQEEAPSFNKIAVVTRETTERKASIQNGNSILVGTNKTKLINTVNQLLLRSDDLNTTVSIQNPYGDGNASERIYSIINGE